MKTNVLDTSTKRISIGVAALTILVLAGAAVYTFMGGTSQPVNGMKIIAAARDYTRALKAKNQPIPPAVPLQALVEQGYLQPVDIGALQGTEANLSLVAPANSPRYELIRVKFSDGSEYVLMADGQTQSTKR